MPSRGVNSQNAHSINFRRGLHMQSEDSRSRTVEDPAGLLLMAQLVELQDEPQLQDLRNQIRDVTETLWVHQGDVFSRPSRAPRFPEEIFPRHPGGIALRYDRGLAG